MNELELKIGAPQGEADHIPRTYPVGKSGKHDTSIQNRGLKQFPNSRSV